MRMRKLLLIIIPLLLIAGGAAWLLRPQAPPTPRLCVVNTLSKDLSVIDPLTQKSLGRIPLQAYGYGAAVTKSGERAYIATGPFPRGGKVTEAVACELLEVDLRKMAVTRRMAMPELAPLSRVHLVDADRSVCVVTAAMPGKRNSERGRVIFVYLARGSVAETVNIGFNPLDSVLTPDGKTLFTADWGSKSISVVNIPERRLADTIPLTDAPPRQLACAPDGGKVFAALESGSDESLLEIDTRALTVTPIPLARDFQTNAMAITGDGRLYLAGRDGARWGRRIMSEQMTRNKTAQTIAPGDTYAYGLAGSYTLLAYDPANRKITKRYNMPTYTAAIAARGDQLYLVNSADDRQSVMMNNVAGNYASSTNPRQPASTPSRTLSVFDPKSGDTLTTIPLGEFPQGCVLNGR